MLNIKITLVFSLFTATMKVVVVLLTILYCVNAAPNSLFGFAEYEPFETPTPVAKLNVIYDNFVDVIIGNPGRTVRLRLDFSSNTSLVLFTAPDDLSREYSTVPPTLLVYLGPALVRLTFQVNLSLYDSKSTTKYDGLLGLGYSSDLWKYWATVSVSSKRLVLGEFDKSLSRSTYNPFRLDFTRDEPSITVRIRDQNFTLSYEPAEYYSTFPHILYHNITNFDLKFNKLHMEIDKNDIRMHLTSGFDRTLVKKNINYEDMGIVLGQHFAHNFVLYYDLVNRSKHLMPAFDLFAIDHAEPVYSYILLVLFFFVSVLWTSIISTPHDENKEVQVKLELIGEPLLPPADDSDEDSGNVRPIVYSSLELYTYIAAAVICIVEVNAFAYYRHLAFLMSSTETTAYVIFNSGMVATLLVGSGLAVTNFNETHWLNARRVFVEATLALLLWMILTHWTHVMSTIVQVIVIATFCVIRGLQTAMAIITGNQRIILASGLYLVLGVLFYVFYVLIPIIDFYFFGFAHAFNAGVFIFSFTLAVPLMAVLAFYPTSLLRNSIISLDSLHHLTLVPRKQTPQPPEPRLPISPPPQSRSRPPAGFGFQNAGVPW